MLFMICLKNTYMIYVFLSGLFINVHSENNRCAPLIFPQTNSFLTGNTQPFTGDYGNAFYIFTRTET